MSPLELLIAVRDYIPAAINAMDFSDWIAFAAAVAASIAAWQAVRSTRFAAKMYALAIDGQRRTETPLEIYLMDSRLIHVSHEHRRAYEFHLLVTNKSLVANSIKQITLTLHYDEGEQPPSNLSIEHDPHAVDTLTPGAPDTFVVPSPIAGGGAVSGTALFSIADKLPLNRPVATYTVEVLDAHDRPTHCQQILLKESQ